MANKGRKLWEDYKRGSGYSAASSGQTQSSRKSSSVEPTVKSRGQEEWEKFKASGGLDSVFSTSVVDDFIRDSQAYMQQAGQRLQGMNWESARNPAQRQDWSRDAGSLQRRYHEARAFLRDNADRFDPENRAKLQSYLDQFDRDFIKVQEGYRGSREFYDQFQTEKDYRSYVAAQEELENKKNLDLDAYARETAELEKSLDAVDYDWTDANQREKADAEVKKIQDEVYRRKLYLNQARALQEKERLSSVANPESKGYDPEFETKREYKSTETEDFWGKLTSQYNMGYADLAYEYINRKEMRDEINQNYAAMKRVRYAESPFQQKGYDHLTDGEIDIYNYYYANGGKQAAQKYLDSIQEDLNYRKAAAMYAKMEGKTGLEMLHGVEAGLDQFASGIKGAVKGVMGEESYTPPTATQFASGMVRKDLEDNGWKLPQALGGASVGQVGYDAITTTTNMVPSILGSVLANAVVPGSGAVVGNALMGASAAGNAYEEAIREGHDKAHARAYAAAMGGSEVAMQYVLGGISKLGGVVSNHAISKALAGVESGVRRAALELGGSMASEALEEGVQEVMTPVFERLFLNKEDAEVDWSEVAYSAILGGLTAGVLEGPGTVAEALRKHDPNTAPAEAGKTYHEPVAGTEEQKQAAEAAQQPGQAVPEAAQVPVQEMAEQEETVQEEPEEAPITLKDLSEKYGSRAADMEKTYLEGQDVQEYDRTFQMAYDMGKSGLNKDALNRVDALSGLSQSQREIAYEIGQTAAAAAAKAQSAKNAEAANGKTGWHKGVVRGEGVKIADLTKTFNDPQRKAYSVLSTIAEATGIDIVLYQSGENSNGEFEGAQGRFQWNSNAIYIDVNAGLRYSKDVGSVAKYAMVRTFGHEFTHFIEKWNPEHYNEFRNAVFSTMQNPEDLIERKLSQDSTGKMTYDDASREVVAEAMTDILEDSNFLQELAKKQPSVLKILKDKISEYLENLKSYFRSLSRNGAPEAKQLKKEVGDSISYLEDIVKQFDAIAVEAVENYQKTVAEDATASKEEAVDAKTEETQATESKTAETDSMEPESVLNNRTPDSDKTASEPAAQAEAEPSFEEVFRNATQEERQEVVDAMEENMGGFTPMYPTEKPAQESNTEQQSKKIDGFSITPNTERGTLEIRFDSKPGEEVRDSLKANKFRWSSKNKLWYGKGDPDTIAGVIREKMGKAEIPETIPQTDTAQNSQVQNITEEANNNGKEDDTVRSSVTHREGTSQLLDEVQAGDVPSDGEGRDTLGSADERGRETGRHGAEPDSQRDDSGAGTGSGQSGDLRGGVNQDSSAGKKASPLQKQVSQEIAQKSTKEPGGSNFVIGDTLDLPSGEKSRYKANVDAIRLVKQLEAEKRNATAQEQEVLSKYVGWGGLAGAFDARNAKWAAEYKELREILSEQEYKAARGSTLNAHYTDISVIKAMYDGLNGLGFQGGRMLEPASGVGNFVGAMPSAMSQKVKSWTMVELDSITGLIAKHLYPHADVRIQGFEKANIANNSMDVAISNVPFGNYAVADKAYPKKVTGAIHNYFFAKSLDKVRPGGIVMFITSSYTMDSSDSTVRKYLMQRADLLGAIRLPNNAFKGNAGTEVVTDILVLKKRPDGTAYSGQDFLEAPYTRPVENNYNGANINTYFTQHPEMVLGTADFTGSMYRGGQLTYNPLEGKGSLADQIRQAFTHIEGKMDYPAKLSPEKTNFAVENQTRKGKKNSLTVKDGKVYQKSETGLTEVQTPKGYAERISGMIGLRDLARDLMNYQQQGVKDSEIRKVRKQLNEAYDAFVAKYGFLNAQTNRNAIKMDPDYYSVLALENWNPDTKKAEKSDIFTKNTVSPNRTITSVQSVSDGLIVSVNQTGGVDVSLISKLSGRTSEDVMRELIDSRKAFKTVDGGLETAEKYLSGNVRAKLREAEAMAPIDRDFQNNVDALKAVIPKDVSYSEIFVNPGTPWIPASVYSDFAAHILGGSNSQWRQDVDITRNPETGNFTVDLKNARLKWGASNTQKWGTSSRSFLELFDAMLNSKSVVVKKKTVDDKVVVDQDATAAANEKVEEIRKEFQDWLWKDESRRVELEKLYNETFNAIVTPKYNGDNLTVNGANASKPLRPHQRDAVQRIVSSGGNTLLAHRVGAGKTYEMAAAAMKLKELGLVKKPMFAVPKSLVAQWGNEFHDFFPTARLLVAEAGDFTAGNRKIFANRIANGDYDAVIVSYEQFEKLPISDSFALELYQEQIDSVIEAIEEAKAEKGGKSLSVKDLEKKRKSLQAKIDKLTDSQKDTDNISFEELGVDSLFVDEAHNFKNLFYTTSMTNVAGLGNKDGSKRAFDLYTKVRYLQKLNGGRGIVFATATPVMNSMSEMYIMQKYLQPDLLNQLGLNTFDAWAKQFGEVVNGVEIKPSGQGYRVKQSFSKFKNLSELQLLFRNFADVLTEVPGLKIPKMKGGKVEVVVCEPGEFQQDYMKLLEERADHVKNVDPSVDNMLKITSDGRKISYTQRMIDPSLPYEAGCKVNRCIENVARVYRESGSISGTQMIFCDMATPKGKSTNTETDVDTGMDMESARIYDDIKSGLVRKGIPAKEIAFIHDADTDAKKKKLQADVNDGKIRVLIGSTGKMGVGLNAQKRITAIHHLDAPWRPGDVEQRNGRAYRQGNMNSEVSCFTYVTEGSFDARLWDILERKQNFIDQIMNGENVGREAEDTGEVTLSAAEVKALASGSPLIMEQVQLDTDIKKLESLYRSYNSAKAEANMRKIADMGAIQTMTRETENVRKDISARTDAYQDGKFSMVIGKKTFTDKKETGTALMAAAMKKANFNDFVQIGTFAGFPMKVIKTEEGIRGVLAGSQKYNFKTYPGNTTYMVNQIVSVIEGLENRVDNLAASIESTRADMAEQEAILSAPFAKQAELDQKRARYQEVMDLLNPKQEQILDEDEGKVQYQGREQEDTPYSYDWFVSKPDMAVTTVTGTVPNSRADVVYYAKQNAAKIGKVNPQNGSVSVYVKDIRTDVLVGTDGLKHGLRRIRDAQNDPNYIVTMKAGEILQNSIKINEANPKKENATGSYVLIGICRNVNGDTYVVRSIVNHFKNELASMDVLYAINAKKELAAAQPPRSTAKPLSVTSSTISISDLLDIVNQNFPDILPESVLKHYGYSARPDGDFGENVLYQQRTETLTDREVLSMAAEEIQGNGNLSAAESDALQIFRDRLSKLDELQGERRNLGREYKELQFGENVDRAKAAQTLEKMRSLDSQIQEADNKVLVAETAPILKQVLPKARRIVEQTQKAKDDATLQRWRDRRNNAASIKKYRDRISKDVRDMTDWIISPSNKADLRHVPDALKNTVIPFLTSIDFTSKRQLNGGAATKADEAFLKRLNALESCLKGNISETGLYSGYNDLPPDFMERLQGFIKTAQDIVKHGNGQFVINQMTAQELKELSGIVTVLKKHIQNFNRFHANAVYSHVYDAGDATIQELNQYQDAKSRGKAGEGMNNFIFWQQIRPAYAFERFGKGGKAIYDGLRRGQAKLAFNTREIVDFSQKAYTEQEVRDWEKEIKTVKIGEESVQMKVSQIMSLYELLKRDQARGHIFGQGIRFATFTADGKKISDTGHIISLEDANRIIGELTPRQIAVADALQEFMQRKGGEWGNFVSMKRFGEAQFGEAHYFPINSDGRHLNVNADENPSAASLYALLNMGFTKKLQEKANNRLVLYSIFDVFSNHMASMAQYNSMALPVLDALKWFNYQQKEDTVTNVDGEDRIIHEVKDSVRDQLDRVFGVPEETRPGSGKRGYAENFIVGILKAFNGTETQGISSDSPGLNSLRHYNMAQVAYNLRVVVQQPLAITRAAMIINYGSIIRGMKLSPAAIQRNIAEMQKYSGIAAWKDLGFYDTNISRGLTDIIKHNETFRDKLGNVGMWGAEKADQLTWAAIWSACKEEVSRKRGIQPGSEAFYEAVSSLFEEVVYKTQVVDSVLTKNEFLRSKGFFARATGSFMSEPTTTASMLADAFDKYRMDLQKKGATPREAWEKNWRNIGRTAYVYGVGAVILAAVQAVADGFRDDDKYEKYGDKWQEAFIGNFIDELMPFNKLPIISDVYDLAKELLRVVGVDTYGNPPASVFMQWYDSLVKGTEIIYKKITGNENNKYTWYGGAYKLLQAVSGMTGLPMAAATREIVTIWNNTVGQMVPSYLIRSYEQKPELEIKYSFQDGYLTELEAQNALVRDAGFTAEEAAQKVSVMAFRKAYPEYADEKLFSETSVQKYLEYGKPNGIDPGICFDILSFGNAASADVDKKGNPISGSKKKKILAYIHKQNLTRAQKDAIYKMFGYSADTLKETPWH